MDNAQLPPPQPQKKSSVMKGCLIASGIGCLVVILAIGAISFVTYRFVKKQYGAVMEKFENQGYQTVEGQVVTMSDPVAEPTLYIAQSVSIRDGSERGLAFMCQTAEIRGHVKGNVYFMGQMLTIHEGAVIDQDLELTAQVVNNFGTVNGQVKGMYQVMNTDPDNPANPDDVE